MKDYEYNTGSVKEYVNEDKNIFGEPSDSDNEHHIQVHTEQLNDDELSDLDE